MPRTLSLYQFFHLLRIKGNWWTKIPECWSQNHKNQKWQSNALPAKYCNFHQLLMGVQFIFNVVWESRKNYMTFVHNVFHLQFLNLIFSALGRRAAMAPPSWETSNPASSRYKVSNLLGSKINFHLKSHNFDLKIKRVPGMKSQFWLWKTAKD